jgi:hypothetical protein
MGSLIIIQKSRSLIPDPRIIGLEFPGSGQTGLKKRSALHKQTFDSEFVLFIDEDLFPENPFHG